MYKCSNNSLNWFTSYLQNRYQSTTVNGKISTKLPLTKGDPQGSILGPLLFILDIRDNCYPSKDMILTLKWMPIVDRIDYRKAIMVYKSLNDQGLEYMTNTSKLSRHISKLF